MVDTNFSINAAGNLEQYNLVTNKEETKDAITADDIKVMIKLGQFNKIRGLIRELENSSPDDKEAAQKIAAFAGFYKKEINDDFGYEYWDKGSEVISASYYESLVEEGEFDIEQYNVSDGTPEYKHKESKDILAEEYAKILSNEWPGFGYSFGIVDARTITRNDIEKILANGEHEKLYTLIQYFDEGSSRPEMKEAVAKIRKCVVGYSRNKEFHRQFEDNPNHVLTKKIKIFDFNPVTDSAYMPVRRLSAVSEAEELAKFFESKGDIETANKIREEIKKVSDRRDVELEEFKGHEVQRRGSENVSELGTESQPPRFNNKRSARFWNMLDEDSRKRILDLLEKGRQSSFILETLKNAEEMNQLWSEKKGW
jgi:hypothetical protein